MKKRLLSALLVLCMMLTMAPVAFATGNGVECTDGENCQHVAAIGATHYETLQDAVDAVSNGTQTTITLLHSASGNGVIIPSGSKITFDLGGFTYDINGETVGSSGTKTNGFQLLRDSNITFKNGTITSTKAKILIQNYSNLTLDGVTLNGAQLTGSAPYTLSNNFGDTVIKDSTIIAASNGYAFDVYYWPKNGYGDGLSVTVEGNSEITGKIEYGSDGTDTGKVAEKASLNIKGGTFTGSLNTYGLDDSDATGINITGGNFQATDTAKWEEYVQDGMKLESGSVVINADTAVAQIGSVGYGTLQAALDAAQDDDTVKLLKNVELTDGVNIDKKVELDLNGFTITNAKSWAPSEYVDYLVAVKRGGDLTIEDSAGSGKIDAGDLVCGVKMTIKEEDETGDDAVLTVNGGTIQGKYYGISGNGTRHGTTITINSGTITATDEAGTAIYHPQDGSLTVNGGEIKSFNTAIEIRSGTLTVTGGTITGGSGEPTSTTNGGGTTTSNAAVAIAQHTTKKPITVNIEGGTLKGGAALYESDPNNIYETDTSATKPAIEVTGGTFEGEVSSKNVNGFISGGTFTGEVAEGALDAGCKLGEDGAVVPADDSEASIGSKGYTTLEEAIAAVQPGDTINLLQNAEISDYVTLNVDNVVLNGNDKMLTCTATGQHGAIDVTADNVTIQNIKINSEKNYGVQFYNVTGGKLSKVNITGGKYTSVFVNASGDITIEDSTLNPTANPYYAAIEYGMGSGDNLKLPGKLTIDDVSGNNPITIWTDKASTNAMISKSDSGYTADNVADKISQNIVNENSGSITINVAVEKDGETSTETTTKPGTGSSSSGGGGGSSSSSYTVSVASGIDNGKVTVSPKSASKGKTVTVTVKPNDGYVLDTLTVTDKDGKAIELTKKSDTEYTFKMPASKVTISATFAAETVEPTSPFSDVATSAYYYDAVLWAVDNGITNGTTATTFSPNADVSRAQMVTFLWRAAGSPKATGVNPFTDVKSGDYYYDAVLWAVANGVTNGTTETTFSPAKAVSRAQAVTFQWRAAGSPAASADSFADVAADAYYADAVAWAVANEITNGMSATSFGPDVTVSRAQAVTFLYRAAN